MRDQISGVWTALVTPMIGERIDEEAFTKLIAHQVGGGVAGLVVCGSTGEASTLQWHEKEKIIGLTVEQARKHTQGRVGNVMCGASATSTAETAELVKQVVALGVDYLLIAPPAYIKPTQEGLYAHFCAAAAAANGRSIVLYNIPGRTAVNLLPSTIARIARECPNVVAVKEASGDIVQMIRVTEECPQLTLLSGDDYLLLPVLGIGGKGVISVASNVAPELVVEVVRAFAYGNLEHAQKMQRQLVLLADALFCESNPIPAKYALSRLGIGTGDVRLPLTPATEKCQAVVESRLRELGLLAAE